MAFRIIHSIAATSRFAELMKMLIVLFVNTGRGSPETIGYLCKCSPTHFDRTSRFSLLSFFIMKLLTLGYSFGFALKMYQ